MNIALKELRNSCIAHYYSKVIEILINSEFIEGDTDYLVSCLGALVKKQAPYIPSIDKIDAVKLFLIKYQNLLTDDMVFFQACMSGDLEVVKIIYDNKPIDNTWEFDSIFTQTCMKNNYLIAQWLCEIKPYDYILEIFGEKILYYAIRPLGDRRWMERRLILLTHCIVEGHVFNKLSTYIIREICEFI